jgi:hypothetical protein
MQACKYMTVVQSTAYTHTNTHHTHARAHIHTHSLTHVCVCAVYHTHMFVCVYYMYVCVRKYMTGSAPSAHTNPPPPRPPRPPATPLNTHRLAKVITLVMRPATASTSFDARASPRVELLLKDASAIFCLCIVCASQAMNCFSKGRIRYFILYIIYFYLLISTR